MIKFFVCKRNIQIEEDDEQAKRDFDLLVNPEENFRAMRSHMRPIIFVYEAFYLNEKTKKIDAVFSFLFYKFNSRLYLTNVKIFVLKKKSVRKKNNFYKNLIPNLFLVSSVIFLPISCCFLFFYMRKKIQIKNSNIKNLLNF